MAGVPRQRTRLTIPVCTRLTPQQISALDYFRADMSRSRWIERLVQAALLDLVQDHSSPQPPTGKRGKPGYIGAYLPELPRHRWQPHQDDLQLQREPGADDGDDSEMYEPAMSTVAPMDRRDAVERRANRRTAKEQAVHSHAYDAVVAQNGARTLSRCACGALSGWVEDSAP